MVTETLLHSPSTPTRYIGSPIARASTPARCGRVQQDQVILGSMLGCGGFGSVYVASMRGRTVAVKMYHKRCGNPRALRQSYSAELAVYRLGLKHSNIVSVLGATSLSGFQEGAWIVMDYVGQENLQNILNDPHRELNCQTRLSYALQMARGLHYLHSLSIVHLDLKPANCLLTHDLRLLRIADFGCCHFLLPTAALEEEQQQKTDKAREEDRRGSAAKLEAVHRSGDGVVYRLDKRDGGGLVAMTGGGGGGDQRETALGAGPGAGRELREGLEMPERWNKDELAGTLAYRAPELLKGQRPTTRSDVYSLGITLWQMRTRKGPYEGVPPHAVVYQVVAKDLRPRQPSVDSDDPFETIFSDLYTQCWAKAEADRPSSQEVVQAVGLWMDNMET